MRPFAILLAATALAGCAAGPDFRTPSPPIQQAYLSQDAPAIGPASQGEPAQRVAMGQALPADWWTRLG
jgi:hypothetical protein